MEKNKLMIFESNEFGAVRVIDDNDEPWFVSADVCKALGISRTAARRLDDDEKGVRSTHTLGGKQSLTCVNESGLYSLILGSRKPEAKAFKRWITHEVIPSIRKHGAYVADSVLDQLEEHPELISDFIQQLRDENAEAKKNRVLLEQTRAENAVLTPKAGYYDSFVGIDDLTCLRFTAKELGVPQKKFIGYLIDNGYVYRDYHRFGRVFVRAGKRNDPLFMTRDFYLPNAIKSEYTLVTPVGKEYFKARTADILAWEPKKEMDKQVSLGERMTYSAVYAQ